VLSSFFLVSAAPIEFLSSNANLRGVDVECGRENRRWDLFESDFSTFEGVSRRRMAWFQRNRRNQHEISWAGPGGGMGAAWVQHQPWLDQRRKRVEE